MAQISQAAATNKCTSVCKMKYVHRTEDNSPVRYLYEVHWIMEDGMWEIEERIKRIVEWSYINYNGKLIKEA